MKLFGKWTPRVAGQDQKGETNFFYIFLSVLIAAVAIIAWNYYHDHDSDIRIHVPKVEVH